jgi:hypothetical protein
MCPGGTVVAAASEEKRLVTNGMSQYEAYNEFLYSMQGIRHRNLDHRQRSL